MKGTSSCRAPGVRAHRAELVLIAALFASLGLPAALAQCVQWTQLQPPGGPSPRSRAVAVYDTALGGVVLYGGATNAGYSQETWLWNGQTWSLLGTTGPQQGNPRMTMAYDSARSVIVLLAGGPVTYEWDGTTWQTFVNSGGTNPTGGSVGTVYDITHAALLAFDGTKTWTYAPATHNWSVAASTGPGPRTGAGLAFDGARGRLVLFGGQAANPMGDTWEWNGAAWTQVATTGPAARAQPALVYDSVRQRIILVGDEGSGALTDVWEWDGTHWIQINNTVPVQGRINETIVYDGGRALVLYFGGELTAFLNDLWYLNRLTPALLQQPVNATVIAGTSAGFGVTATGPGTVTYQWRKNGVAISGATGAFYGIPVTHASDAGNYDVVLTIPGGCDSVTSTPAALIVRPLGDINCDGVVDFNDINPFVACLVGAWSCP